MEQLNGGMSAVRPGGIDEMKFGLVDWAMGGLWALAAPMAPPKRANINKQTKRNESMKQKKESEINQLNLNEFVFVEWNEVKWNKTNHEFNWIDWTGPQGADAPR